MPSNLLEKSSRTNSKKSSTVARCCPKLNCETKVVTLRRRAIFLQVLRVANGLAVISEMKKASPSAGVPFPSFDPLQIAQAYAAAGVEAISVLTDEEFFQGSLQYLERIRPLAQFPLLRKDFILSPYQIYEARAYGADAVLLIVAALSHEDVRRLLEVTHALGMHGLVEVHETREMERALSITTTRLSLLES